MPLGLEKEKETHNACLGYVPPQILFALLVLMLEVLFALAPALPFAENSKQYVPARAHTCSNHTHTQHACMHALMHIRTHALSARTHECMH